MTRGSLDFRPATVDVYFAPGADVTWRVDVASSGITVGTVAVTVGDGTVTPSVSTSASTTGHLIVDITLSDTQTTTLGTVATSWKLSNTVSSTTTVWATGTLIGSTVGNRTATSSTTEIVTATGTATISTLVGAESAAALAAHEADTTSIHGITNTATLYSSGGTDVAVADGGTGSSTAAAARTALDVQRLHLFDVREYGAVGDGTTDDTTAIDDAYADCPSGGTMHFPPGTYLRSTTWVLTKPVAIVGGAKEQTTILFAASGSYLASPYKCGILAPHSTTSVPGHTGDAVRSTIGGITLQMQAGPTDMTGLVIATPISCDETDAVGFSRDGFAVNANVSPDAIVGNANGTTLTNCKAMSNTRHGFYVYGNNAQACVFTGCKAPGNGGWGFFEDSYIGNLYLGCETDLNTAGGYGGYATVGAVANRSIYIGCYAESNQPVTWGVGPYSIRIGALNDLGAATANEGLGLSMIPSGSGYLNVPLSFASTQQIAQDQSGGTWLKLSSGGLSMLGHSAGQTFSISGVPSSNYTDLLSGGTPTIRLPNFAVTGNIAVGRPFLPQGLSLSGDSMVVAGTAAPTTGTYSRGAIVFNEAPVAGGTIGWVCTSGGTPGTWKTWGAISA